MYLVILLHNCCKIWCLCRFSANSTNLAIQLKETSLQLSAIKKRSSVCSSFQSSFDLYNACIIPFLGRRKLMSTSLLRKCMVEIKLNFISEMIWKKQRKSTIGFVLNWGWQHSMLWEVDKWNKNEFVFYTDRSQSFTHNCKNSRRISLKVQAISAKIIY